MARRVTEADIKQINEVYYVCKNYAKTAAATGWSAATVHKYVKSDYVPDEVARPSYEFHPMSIEDTAKSLKNQTDITLLTEEEKRGYSCHKKADQLKNAFLQNLHQVLCSHIWQVS